MPNAASALPVAVSIGLLARNEADSIGRVLDSIFSQNLFAELGAGNRRAEILCVVNGSTDATADRAAEILDAQSGGHPDRRFFTARVHTIREAGKINAWNVFVHRLSSADAEYLILVDADIALGNERTLWNLCHALEGNPAAIVTVGEPIKDLALRERPTLRERISLSTSRMTQSAPAQLTGQLYCIRASTARRIRLPRDLAACEDGFIKTVVCTDFLTRKSQPERIMRVPDASHVFEAYVSAGSILRNQKRQMIGQTYVHVLVDRFLPRLPPDERLNLEHLVRRLDSTDRDWLRRIMREHMRQSRFFWRLFPGILTFRLQRLANLSARGKIRHAPAALAGLAFTLAACWMAARALRAGTTHYWPDKALSPQPDSAGQIHPREIGQQTPAP